MTKALNLTTPGDCEIMITRQFAAPREIVFDAWTKAELLQKWLLGPPGWSFVVCESDAQRGGKYRFAWKGPAGEELAMHGVYQEFQRPERVVNTQLFENNAMGDEVIGTLTLSEENGKTVVTNLLRYSSPEARDMALKHGMDRGMEASHQRLDELLEELA